MMPLRASLDSRFYSLSAVVALFACIFLAHPSWAESQAKPAAKKAAPKKAAAAARKSNADAASSLEAFCTEWMHKLSVRQSDNIAHIKWDTTATGVQGTYVGYTEEHTCRLMEGDGVPVAKIGYREVTYTKRGASISEAQISVPEPVEVNEVTEIFSYNKGKWDF